MDVLVAETQEQQAQTDLKETLVVPDNPDQMAEIQLDRPVEQEDDGMLPALDPFAPLEDEEELGGDEPQAWEQLLAEPDTKPDLPLIEEDNGTGLEPVTDPAGAYFEELEQTAEISEEVAPLLDDVPPPIPGDWLPDEQPSEQRAGFLEELITDGPRAGEQEEAEVLDLDSEEFDAELAAVLDEAFKGETQDVDAPASMEEAPSLEYDAEITQVATPSTSDVDTLPHEFEPVFPSGADDTIPASGFGQSRKQLTEFESESPALVSLTYSCVLLPRLTEHHLTGELASHVSELTTQLCVAFGWRLEQLSIRPDYLYWMG